MWELPLREVQLAAASRQSGRELIPGLAWLGLAAVESHTFVECRHALPAALLVLDSTSWLVARDAPHKVVSCSSSALWVLLCCYVMLTEGIYPGHSGAAACRNAAFDTLPLLRHKYVFWLVLNSSPK